MPRGDHENYRRGRVHYRWSDRKMISAHGYVKVRVGREHPLADPNGYCYEHKVVLAAAGVRVPPGCVVHHRNGDKTDNRIENLEVIPRGVHNAHHNQERGRDSEGRFIGKRRAGRLLDGVQHDAMPQP